MDLSEWFLEAFNPGWGYLVQVGGSKQFRRGYPDIGLFRNHLGLDGNDPRYLAIRPNSKTTPWVAIDIDEARSPYHPHRGRDAMDPLLERCRLMGLRSPLVFRSSFSQGIHIWFPLARPVETFRAAVTLSISFRATQFSYGESGDDFFFEGNSCLRLENGLLEAFPNPKDLSSGYKQIRLPFSGEGNGLYVDGFGVVDEPAALPALWADAAKSNSLIEARTIGAESFYSLVGDPEKGEPEIIPLNWIKTNQSISSSVSAVKSRNTSLLHQVVFPRSLAEAKTIISRGWTASGQTQSLQLAALMIAGSESGCPQQIAFCVRELLTKAPGFLIHCGHVDEIKSMARPGRSACVKAARFDPSYKGSWKETGNIKRSMDATERAFCALRSAGKAMLHRRSINSAIALLSSSYGAPSSKRWWYADENIIAFDLLKSLIA